MFQTELIYFLKQAESFDFTLMMKRVSKELKLKVVSFNFEMYNFFHVILCANDFEKSRNFEKYMFENSIQEKQNVFATDNRCGFLDISLIDSIHRIDRSLLILAFQQFFFSFGIFIIENLSMGLKIRAEWKKSSKQGFIQA